MTNELINELAKLKVDVSFQSEIEYILEPVKDFNYNDGRNFIPDDKINIITESIKDTAKIEANSSKTVQLT